MNLKINQNILVEHLNYVIKGISNKNLIPILNCIKFELTNDGLTLYSTDNEISIISTIPKKNIEEIGEVGSFVVAGRFIYEIIKKLPNEIINIEEVVNSKIIITTPKSSFNLNCNNVNDFPEIIVEKNKEPIELENQVFKNLITKTVFATSNQESRPVLTGINFKIKDNILEATATDSYRLSKKTIEIKNNYEEEINIIIPARNLIELIKMINDDEKLSIHIFNNKIIFINENLIIISRLINGTYPDTSKLIPETFTTELEVSTDDFYAAIDRASLLTNETDKNTIKLDNNKKEIIISSNIPEIGNVTENLECLDKVGEDIKIAFSSKYMLDALKTLEADKIKLLFNGDVKPIILKNIDDETLVELILPIRTY